MTIPDQPGGRRPWETDREWARLSARIAAVDAAPAGGSFGWRPVAAIAAGIVAVAATGLYAVKHRSSGEPSSQVVSTTAGQRIVVRLGDSSMITLGPATTARITASNAHRVVELEGMADFRITHDSTRPFIVRANGTETRDLGTEFTVRAYSSDSSVNVAVTSGTVSFTSGGAADATVTLRAGEVARAMPGHAPTQQPVDARRVTSWIDGGLSFENEPLSSVARELSRWFDADIRIASPALGERRVSAVYHDPTLDGVVDALSATLGIRAVRNGRVVTLYAGGQ